MPAAEPETIDEALLRSWPLPSEDGDKSDRGTVLVVGGARQTPGAVLLAAETALRVGAGKVQVATTTETADALAVALPEAYVEGLPTLEDGELATSGAERVLELAGKVDVVLFGPGLGSPDGASSLGEQVLPRLDTAVVLDALGTAFLTGNLDGVRHLSGRAVLTPNSTELAAMLGRDEPEEGVDQQQLEACRAAADATGVVVLSGADDSYVVAPGGQAWTCPSGPAGLATAGSGDVKAGLVAALLARGAEPQQAAVWAAWLHARAGSLLGQEQPGFLARDVARAVPRALADAEATARR
jgi:ADP-dependent NAD(P)H-hydrate dehydratase